MGRVEVGGDERYDVVLVVGWLLLMYSNCWGADRLPRRVFKCVLATTLTGAWGFYFVFCHVVGDE